MGRERLRVVLADDSLIVHEGLRSLIGIAPDLEVVGMAVDSAELIARAEQLEPHVVVTDIRMPPTFQREGSRQRVRSAGDIPAPASSSSPSTTRPNTRSSC